MDRREIHNSHIYAGFSANGLSLADLRKKSMFREEVEQNGLSGET